MAPLNKETEESQKEQAVSQQMHENGATPTGGQAWRRNGPASMAASYLNIAQLLGKAGRWGPVQEESWVCFPQNLFARGKKSRSLWLQPAVGGAVLSASSKSCLPLVCRRTVLSGELPKCLERRRPHPAVHSTSLLALTSLPQALEASRHGSSVLEQLFSYKTNKWKL